MKTLKQILYPTPFTDNEKKKIIKAVKEWLQEHRNHYCNLIGPEDLIVEDIRLFDELIEELEQ